MRKFYRIALAGMLFAALGATGAARANVNVTVLDNGATVSGGRVCLGTSTNRTAFATALTNAAGVAVFAQVPSGAFVVTADQLNRGALATVPAGVAAPVLTLQLNAGGLCARTSLCNRFRFPWALPCRELAAP